jgi:hypothetical protein
VSISVLTDAVNFVRSHPEMFFPGAAPAPIPCVQHLVAEVLALGASDVAVERRGDWWIVSSNFDWFLPDQSADEQVRRIVPLPEVGPNASRVEVVLVAFAEAVATRNGPHTWKSLTGPGLPADVEVEGITTAGRTVAFRFRDQCTASLGT